MNDAWRTLVGCSCSGCGQRSGPRPVGTAPEGWQRVSADSGRVEYRCPDCPTGERESD